MEFYDDFEIAGDGLLDGRVSLSGHVWSDLNDAARVVGGQMIRNPAQEGQAIGVYGAVELDNAVKLMEASVDWLDVSGDGTGSDVIQENGSLVLICGSTPDRTGAPPNVGIYRDCVHAVFGPWLTSVTTYTDGVLNDDARSFPYAAGRLDVNGTDYDIGMILDGNRIGIKPPDRDNYEWIGAPNYAEVSGRHMIWQTFNTTAPDLRPRFNSVYATDALPAFNLSTGVALATGLPL